MGNGAFGTPLFSRVPLSTLAQGRFARLGLAAGPPTPIRSAARAVLSHRRRQVWIWTVCAGLVRVCVS